jgi:hypothetical protein
MFSKQELRVKVVVLRIYEDEVAMSRSFESVRMGAKEVSQRWLKASGALKKEDQIYGQRLAEMAKKHSSEAFYALEDPLEAAVFSVLVELSKELEKKKDL